MRALITNALAHYPHEAPPIASPAWQPDAGLLRKFYPTMGFYSFV
ncbi:hypothetical protein ACNKHO_02635 [Shigella flexneri]